MHRHLNLVLGAVLAVVMVIFIYILRNVFDRTRGLPLPLEDRGRSGHGGRAMNSPRTALLLLAVGALAWSGCGPAPHPTPLAELNPQQRNGHAIYQARCAVCHYDRQTGRAARPVALRPLQEARPAQRGRRHGRARLRHHPARAQPDACHGEPGRRRGPRRSARVLPYLMSDVQERIGGREQGQDATGRRGHQPVSAAGYADQRLRGAARRDGAGACEVRGALAVHAAGRRTFRTAADCAAGGTASSSPGCLLLSVGYFYLFSRTHILPWMVEGFFALLFFLYLVRPEVRDRML